MLDDRKKELLEYLIVNQSEEWITKKQITEALKELYPRHLEKSNEHNSTAYTHISKDVRAINNDKDVPYLIISSHYGYKLAPNEEKANDYIVREMNRALKILKRTHLMAKKVLNDQQVEIFANSIVEAFPRKD